MKIGYMRVSKADGTQVFDMQHDALIAAGVEPGKIWLDMASRQGRRKVRLSRLPEVAEQGRCSGDLAS